MIIDKLVPAARLARDPLDPYWYGLVGRRRRAGVDVNEDTALTYSACWAATRLLSGTAAYLPFGLYQRMPNGEQRVCQEERLHTVLHDAPNPEMSSMMWRATKVSQQVNWGNCVSEIERDGYGNIVNLWPIHVSRVELKCNEAEQLYYNIHNNDGSHTPLPYADVFHVPSMMSDDGRWGKGVVRFARETVGRALATERYGASWFGNGGRPSAILKHPKSMDKEARANLRREWNEIYGGPDNPNRVAVLWEGMEYSAIASDPEDSQFIQSQQWNVEDVARWYGVPPHMIQREMGGGTAGIEQRGIEYVKFSLLFWIKLWEQEVWRKLLTPAQQAAGYYAKFTVDALERGDVSSRTAALAQQFFNGALTLNQWAKIEDRPPIGPLGDLHFVQSAMVPLEYAAKGPIDPQAQSQLPAPTDIAPQTAKEIPEPAAARIDALEAIQRKQLADAEGHLEILKSINAKLAATEAKPQKSDTLHLATLDVLDGLVGVMLDREAKDAIEAAKKPTEFLKWLDKFYDEHGERMRKALAKPIRACVLASGKPLIVDDTLRKAVTLHVDASRTALLEASGGPPDGFSEAVTRCVTSWKRTEITDLLRGE